MPEQRSAAAAYHLPACPADDLFASPLLEAEYRSALAREGVTREEPDDEVELLAGFRWVLPNRPLSRELARVFSAG